MSLQKVQPPFLLKEGVFCVPDLARVFCQTRPRFLQSPVSELHQSDFQHDPTAGAAKLRQIRQVEDRGDNLNLIGSGRWLVEEAKGLGRHIMSKADKNFDRA